MNYPIEVPEVLFVVKEPEWKAPCHPHGRLLNLSRHVPQLTLANAIISQSTAMGTSGEDQTWLALRCY